MTAFRFYPFIGAGLAVAAVVLAIIGVSTTYWFSFNLATHSGLWQNCIDSVCASKNGGRPAAIAITSLIAVSIAAILAIFSGLARSRTDASNNLARLAGVVAVVLLFTSGVLIASALYTFVGAQYATGYSFTLMIIAQFLSFLGALFVAHWMGHAFTVVS